MNEIIFYEINYIGKQSAPESGTTIFNSERKAIINKSYIKTIEKFVSKEPKLNKCGAIKMDGGEIYYINEIELDIIRSNILT